jgi:hypothetical protein
VRSSLTGARDALKGLRRQNVYWELEVRAISSGVERHVDIVEVGGSKPPSPTKFAAGRCLRLAPSVYLRSVALYKCAFMVELRRRTDPGPGFDRQQNSIARFANREIDENSPKFLANQAFPAIKFASRGDGRAFLRLSTTRVLFLGRRKSVSRHQSESGATRKSTPGKYD